MSRVLVLLIDRYNNPIEAMLVVPDSLVRSEKWDECRGQEVQDSETPEEIRSRICDIYYRAGVTLWNHVEDSKPINPAEEKGNAVRELPVEEELAQILANPPADRDLVKYRIGYNDPIAVDRIIMMCFSS